MTSFNSVNFGDILVRQSQNTARLGFEVRFRAVKRRLDTELNVKKEAYNNIDKTLEPVLAGHKRQRAQLEAQKAKYVEYLDAQRSNISKITDIINNILPKLSFAASDTGPGADTNFDSIRNQLNKALVTLKPASNLEEGLVDRVKNLKVKANPSGVGDYNSYATLPDRANAVGILLTGGSDGLEVIPGLSYGYAEELGLLRNNLTRDFDLIKQKLGETEKQLDKNGKAVFDEKGQPVYIGKSGLYKKMYDLDKTIEKIDAQERLVLLKDIQAMEKKNARALEYLSLSFEFSQTNVEVLSDRTSFLKPQKGSIMNLFI